MTVLECNELSCYTRSDCFCCSCCALKTSRIEAYSDGNEIVWLCQSCYGKKSTVKQQEP